MLWMRHVDTQSGWKYHIISNAFIVQFTGGSIIIQDRKSRHILRKHTGHKYLYTGDIRPDETECFALENGKHFFVYSLESLELVRRVTLPQGYESIDMCGHYSKDGMYIYIPVSRWVGNEYLSQGYYEYAMCRYETEGHTLVDKVVVGDREKIRENRWNFGIFWDPPAEKPQHQQDRDVEAVMKLIFGDPH